MSFVSILHNGMNMLSIATSCTLLLCFIGLGLRKAWELWKERRDRVRKGMRVKVRGLVKREDLNGGWGVVLEESEGRIPVLVDDGSKVLVSKQNLEVVTERETPHWVQGLFRSSSLRYNSVHNHIVTTEAVPPGTLLLCDNVLIRQGLHPHDSAATSYRNPHHRTALDYLSSIPSSDLSPVKHLPAKIRTWCAGVVDRLPSEGIVIGSAHKRVLTETSWLLPHDEQPNCMMLETEERGELELVSIREIEEGETLKVTRSSPFAWCALHEREGKEVKDSKRVCLLDCAKCKRVAPTLGGECLSCWEENQEYNENLEKWLMDITWDHIMQPNKYSHTHAVALLTLCSEKLGLLHWTVAALAAIVLDHLCSGEVTSKLSVAQQNRIQTMVGYLHRWSAYHDAGVLRSCGLAYFLSQRDVGRRVLKALQGNKRVCAMLCGLIPRGMTYSWTKHEQDLWVDFDDEDKGVLEEWWLHGVELFGDFGIDTCRILAAKSKLQQAITSKTDPLSDPYSIKQQSMDGHIDEILHTLGHDRRTDGEHDAGAYMNLLTKLNHGDDYDDFVAKQKEHERLAREKAAEKGA